MSRTDAFVAELRNLADAEQPSLDLDPAAVTRGGRALRRRRAVRTGALAVVVTAVVAGGALQLVRFDPIETGPARSTQEPRTFGPEQTVELAPGVIAANLPERIEIDGKTLQDLGFMSRFVRTRGTADIGLGPSVLESIDALTFGAWTGPGEGPIGSGITMHSLHNGDLHQAMHVSWLKDDAAEDYAPGSVTTSLNSTIGLPDSNEQFTLGSVPSWLAEPEVHFFSERGFILDDGSTSHVLEVPTFRALTADGRLVFAVKITEEQGQVSGDTAKPIFDVVVYRSGDGEVYVGNQCGEAGTAGCLETYGEAWLAVVGAEPGDGDVAVAAHGADGSPLPVTSIQVDDALPRAFADVFSTRTPLPATLSDGDALMPMAVATDGRIVASAAPPDSFSEDVFLAPERLGWWTPEGFEPFDDVSGLPEGDPFRYSYFAATDGETVTWVETSSIQGLGRWRIFAASPDAGTQLLAYAEQRAEPDLDIDHDFGSEALPHPFGDRAVWTSYSSYSKPRDSTQFLLSAPLDGSGPMRVESEAASNVVVADGGAVFAREGGTVISVLREDGSIEDLLHYPFKSAPLVSLAAQGNLLAVSAWFRDDLDASWIDVINLDTMSVTRVERAEGVGERLSVCADRVVWSTQPSGEGTPHSTFFLLDPVGRGLTAVRADDGGVSRGCAGKNLVWSAPDGTGLHSTYELVTFN